MNKVREFISNKKVKVLAVPIMVLAIYSVCNILTAFTFSEWVNCITDVFVGCILTFISLSFYEVMIGDVKYRTWQYLICFMLSIISVGSFYTASRADELSLMITLLGISAIAGFMNYIVYTFIYIPSTMSLEELIDAQWDRMKEKANKLGAVKFLEWEKDFRCYPTIEKKIDSDLDFSSPYYTINDKGKNIPITYRKAVAMGLNNVASRILEDLEAEISNSDFLKQ